MVIFPENKLFPISGQPREIDYPRPLSASRYDVELVFTPEQDIAVTPERTVEGIHFNAFVGQNTTNRYDIVSGAFAREPPLAARLF